jgi:hypothetical protein
MTHHHHLPFMSHKYSLQCIPIEAVRICGSDVNEEVTSDAKDIFSLVGGGSAWRHCWGMSRGTCMYPDEVNATKRFIPPPSRGIIAKFHHIHAREPIS